MRIELSADDLSLIKMILEKDLEEVRIEIHHCRNHEFKDWLKTRQTQMLDLVNRISQQVS